MTAGKGKRELADFVSAWISRREGTPLDTDLFAKASSDLGRVTHDTLNRLADVVDDAECLRRELVAWLEESTKADDNLGNHLMKGLEFLEELKTGSKARIKRLNQELGITPIVFSLPESEETITIDAEEHEGKLYGAHRMYVHAFGSTADGVAVIAGKPGKLDKRVTTEKHAASWLVAHGCSEELAGKLVAEAAAEEEVRA